MAATILYLNTDPSAHIPQMTLAGMRRYASSRGWIVEAYPAAESRKNRLAALFRKHAPVVGCVWECSDDGLPGSPSALDAVPVVYLHVSRDVPENGVMLRADNDAVAVAAFRELSLGRPAAYAVVGVPEAFEWSFVRVKRFCEEVWKAKRHCAAFPWTDGESPSERAGRLTSWVAALPRRTAVFAVNDLVAAEVVAAAHAAFRVVPKEITLLGVDNLPQICEASAPAISSIQIDYERAGYVAARTIGEMAERSRSRAAAGKSRPRPSRRRSVSAGGPAAMPPVSIGPLMAVRRQSTGGRGRREAFVLEAVEIIRRKACDGLTAAALANLFPCSRRLFELRFREALGHSVLEEIQHVRLEKVCELLSNTNVAIDSIAGMCGYRSDIALKWVFRKRMGVSMKEWRVRNRHS